MSQRHSTSGPGLLPSVILWGLSYARTANSDGLRWLLPRAGALKQRIGIGSRSRDKRPTGCHDPVALSLDRVGERSEQTTASSHHVCWAPKQRVCYVETRNATQALPAGPPALVSLGRDRPGRWHLSLGLPEFASLLGRCNRHKSCRPTTLPRIYRVSQRTLRSAPDRMERWRSGWVRCRSRRYVHGEV